MASPCDRRNPLARSGTNQRERALPALDPEFFRVDERTTADLIGFAERLSRHLNYYGHDDTSTPPASTVTGDWQPFFTNDIAAILAGLATLPIGAFQTFARAVQEYLANDIPNRDEADLSDHFRLVFHLPVLLLGDTAGTEPGQDETAAEFLPGTIAAVQRRVGFLRPLEPLHPGAIPGVLFRQRVLEEPVQGDVRSPQEVDLAVEVRPPGRGLEAELAHPETSDETGFAVPRRLYVR
jgi:hypothetical protein